MEHFVIETEEIWRDIEGYEGLYEVSNLGRVKSLERIDNRNHLRKERILRLVPSKYRYLLVQLCKEGKQKLFSVHRLVAQAFLPNPEGLPQINHKNEDKTLNVVFLKDDGSVDECRSNLEWCDGKYNMNYGTRNEREIQTKIRKGIYDPELCGLDRNEHQRLYYKKNLEKMREYKREYMREYRRRKKKQPSE